MVIRATEMCKAKQSNSRTFTKKSVKAFLKPLRFKSLRIPKNVRMVAYVGFRTEKEMKQALQKDKSFLGEEANGSCNIQLSLNICGFADSGGSLQQFGSCGIPCEGDLHYSAMLHIIVMTGFNGVVRYCKWVCVL